MRAPGQAFDDGSQGSTLKQPQVTEEVSID
jgi:hypothetical protein